MEDKKIKKTITYRLMSAVITYTAIFVLTDNHSVSFMGMMALQFLMTLVYYFHERMWAIR